MSQQRIRIRSQHVPKPEMMWERIKPNPATCPPNGNLVHKKTGERKGKERETLIQIGNKNKLLLLYLKYTILRGVGVIETFFKTH